MDHTGFIPEGSPASFYPLQPMGIVHDIIEHQHGVNPDDGSLQNEMRAFGVAHWGRGQGDYWRRTNPGTYNPTAPQNTSGEIVEFFAQWLMDTGDHWFQACPRRPRIDPRGRAMIAETMRLVRETAREEGDELLWSMWRGRVWEPGEPDLEARLKPHLPCIERWLQQGWVDASRRFAKLGPHRLVTAWIELEQRISQELEGRSHPWGEPHVGQVLIVTWDDATGQFTTEWDEAAMGSW